MTKYVELPPNFHGLFSPIRKHPVRIICTNEDHHPPVTADEWGSHSFAEKLTGQVFTVDMNLQQYNAEGRTHVAPKYIHVYTGVCSACGTEYLYSPDATPRQLAVIERTLSGPQ